jgi:hypothetical protein
MTTVRYTEDRYGTQMDDWKPIPSCPGYYASQGGLIKGPRKVMRGWLGKNGYYIFRPGKGKVNRLVHRAVAEAWLEQTGPVVNHINHVKTDNRVVNLEWCTVQHNVACSNLVHGHNKAKLTEENKASIVSEYQRGATSQRKLAAKFGVTQRTIYNVLRSAQR